MNFKLLVILFYLTGSVAYSQTTYFIKYKDVVPTSKVDRKVTEQKFSDAVINKPNSIPEYSISYLAKGLGRGDEVLGRIIKVEFSKDISEDLFSQLTNDPDIEYVQKSNIYKVDVFPNDSLISEQWALKKIKAFDAWDITQGVDTVLLAIIDTGIEYFHRDLTNKIYYNPGEIGLDQFGNDKRFNGIDDDGNGFIDDYMGWDFVDKAGFPFDTTGGDFVGWDNDPYDPIPGNYGYHGTFVGGIAGAESNNEIGISGIAPNIKLLNLRSFDNSGTGEEDDAAAAIIYAVQMGAKVINMSWGDFSFSYVLRDVIRYAYSQNVVLVASSGNDNTTLLHYPSGFPEVISVGNSAENDFTTGSYGSTLDLVAPGSSIISTTMGNTYIIAGGTSASAPHVSAAATLVLSLQNFTNDEVKQIIKSTCDDIGEAKWDLRTGAGRLNLYKALSILAPGRIKINYPHQDFATYKDTLNFNVTIMSPYFLNYSFQYGSGLNPDNWVNLIPDGSNQLLNENIYSLNISNLSEGAYTAKILVELNNGNSTEERINFYIQRTPPEVELVGIGPVYMGNKITLLSEVMTDQDAIVKLYYRQKGSTEFNFITLDGFLINNQFVKQLHYGFIPLHVVKPNTDYEVFLRAINLAGLETEVKEEDGNYFEFRTDDNLNLIPFTELPFNLPRGTIYKEPVNFLSNSNNEILFNESAGSGSDTILQNYGLYRFSDNTLQKQDSILNKIPVHAGDFNSNSKQDLLSIFYPHSYIDEQLQQSGFNLQNKFSGSIGGSNSFYPILVDDFNNDNVTEVISNYFDTLTIVYRINNDLTITKLDSLKNYSKVDSFDSLFINEANTINNAIIADLNGDGIKEIWLADYDGDLISYKILGSGNYEPGESYITNLFTSSNNILSTGDFDGDGIEEIAVLFETNSIAPNFLLLVINFKNNQPNILFEKVFLDQSAEFIGFNFTKVFQSVKLVDLDNDGAAELILNIFPNLYIFKHNQMGSSLIYFQEEGVNSENIFSGDLNQNGVTEIGFQNADGVKFFEFAVSNKAAMPYSLKGYSLDSTSISLSWQGRGERFIIYRTIDNIFLPIDSTTSLNYIDSQLTNNTFYSYAVQSYDASKEIKYSDFSNTLNVYSHQPARVISVINNSPKNLLVTFSEKIRNSVDNLMAFEVVNFGFPNSVSPANQYSYLLSFNEPLPIGVNNLIIEDISDFYGSPVDQQIIEFSVNPVDAVDEFFITSFEILSPNKIKLVFNSDVNEETAVVKENYTFEPANKIVSVEVDQSDKKILYLNLDGTKPVGSIGKEYRIRVSNIKSTGGLTINSGAGSYVVLTSFAKDLSDVYVYPNPSNSKSEKITFANLPGKAKIVIFSLNGERINEIEESDGNGGVDFNLSYSTGEKISSGVYIYRIVMLDDSNNEVEEKIGKFAVVR